MEKNSERKTKVGIASCYSFHNYGSMLQAYATQRIIEKLGYDAITFQCDNAADFMTQSKIINYFHKVSNPNIVKEKIRQAKSSILVKNKYPEIQNQINVRHKFFDAFSNSSFKVSNRNNNREDLKKLSGECKAVVVGSDQLWSPRVVEYDYYTLTYVPDNVRKISYATSIGQTSIPKRMVKKYQDFLGRFYAISVREESAVRVLNSIGINNVQHVLDPTLLLTAEEWMKIQKEEPIYKSDYILVYFLGVNQQHREFVRKLKEKTGYKIVALQHCDEFVEKDVGFADDALYEVGPSEFVNLIRNAQFVCTDSFHGSCFSILNHKKFFTFNRFDDDDNQSTNTRIDSLLSIAGLENRRLNLRALGESIPDQILDDIDYDTVDARLCTQRVESIRFLRDALK